MTWRLTNLPQLTGHLFTQDARNNSVFKKYTRNLFPTSVSPTITTWTKPTAPFVKCNFDAGFHINHSLSTGGWIIRDHQGSAHAWGSSIVDHVNTPSEAETKALLVAMQQGWTKGYKMIQFEGDSHYLASSEFTNSIFQADTRNQPPWLANLLCKNLHS
ncbi:F15O4.5 [Arabidopsis thaliana]|uniref:F15O4.5 n=1 Tax=Arabidopsis thaliana TaxID=3702 RepID=Q9LQH9_ARATH|nr:F15O4.5 [Arabidopsis thaliana]